MLVYNVENSNEDALFPLLYLFKFSREFKIGSLFCVFQEDLTPEKK